MAVNEIAHPSLNERRAHGYQTRHHVSPSARRWLGTSRRPPGQCRFGLNNA